jgi:hypothetical protein
MRRAPFAALIAVAGIGAAWALLVQESPAPHAPRPQHRVAPARAAISTHDPRVRELQAPSTELNARIEVLEDDVTAALPVADTEPIDLEATRRQEVDAALASYAALIAGHEASPVDTGWAHRSRELLDADLTNMLATMDGARLESIECRSSSCIAQLDLASFGSAQEKAAELVSGQYGVNCATRIQLDDATAGEAPYRVQMVFHSCSDDPA